MKENGGNLIFRFISLPGPEIDHNGSDMSSAGLFIFRKIIHTFFYHFKLFVNGKLTQHFHFLVLFVALKKCCASGFALRP